MAPVWHSRLNKLNLNFLLVACLWKFSRLVPSPIESARCHKNQHLENPKRETETQVHERTAPVQRCSIGGKVQKQRHCHACVYFPEAAGHQLVPSQAVRRWPLDRVGSPRAKASADVQYGGWADNLCARGGKEPQTVFCLFFCHFASLKRFFGYSFVFSWYLGVSCVQPLLAIREAMRCSLTMRSLSDGFHPKQKCLSLAVIRRVRICWIDSSINMGSRQIDNSTNGAGRSKRKAFDLGEKEIENLPLMLPGMWNQA